MGALLVSNCELNEMSLQNHLLEITNSSGFPLQIAIENVVNKTAKVHGWLIRYSEHGWSSPEEQQSGFIDLVLQDSNGTFVLVIECKRVRDAHWVFLRSDGLEKQRRHCKAWVSRYVSGSMKYYGWHDLCAEPSCVESSFCAVRGQSTNGSRPMLERTASEVVSSTEALAREEKDYRPEGQSTYRFYFSVIVTTAELFVARFTPDNISLADGSLSDADFQSVPYVRFRKQMSLHKNHLTPEDYANRNLISERESTVFVVNAQHIVDFLSKFEVDESAERNFR